MQPFSTSEQLYAPDETKVQAQPDPTGVQVEQACTGSAFALHTDPAASAIAAMRTVIHTRFDLNMRLSLSRTPWLYLAGG